MLSPSRDYGGYDDEPAHAPLAGGQLLVQGHGFEGSDTSLRRGEGRIGLARSAPARAPELPVARMDRRPAPAWALELRRREGEPADRDRNPAAAPRGVVRFSRCCRPAESTPRPRARLPTTRVATFSPRLIPGAQRRTRDACTCLRLWARPARVTQQRPGSSSGPARLHWRTWHQAT